MLSRGELLSYNGSARGFFGIDTAPYVSKDSTPRGFEHIHVFLRIIVINIREHRLGRMVSDEAEARPEPAGCLLYRFGRDDKLRIVHFTRLGLRQSGACRDC